jgi:hypothetical protein
MSNRHGAPRAALFRSIDESLRAGTSYPARKALATLTLAVSVTVVGCGSAVPATVVLDPTERHQVIIGWEGTVDIGDADVPQDELGPRRGALIDFLIDSVGLNALRLEVRSGDENPVDRTPEMLADIGRMSWFKQGRYVSVNDNDDPFTLNPDGFRWTWLEHLVRTTVIPFKDGVERRGESFYLTLTFVDFGVAQFEQLADPQEYAEFMVAAFTHLRDTFGLVPDALEVVLEPDVGQIWDAETLAEAIIATGDRLAERGFEPAFVAPSTTSMWQALLYYERMATYPRARAYITDVAYHRYRDLNEDWLRRLGELTETHGVRTAMLERIDADYEVLHADLATGRVSRWQQYAMAWPQSIEDDGSVYALMSGEPGEERVVYGRRTAMLSQYFRAIRPGAVRIGASSGAEAVEPLAFENPDGSVTVVLKTSGPAEITVQGLPSGAIRGEYMMERDRTRTVVEGVRSENGEAVVAIPGAGVVTLRGGNR